MCPKDFTICCALVAVAQVGEGSSVLSQGSFVPRIRPMKIVARVRPLAIFPPSYERGSSAHFPHCFFFPPFSSSLHLCHCLIGQVVIFPFVKVVFETIHLRLGLKPTWQGLCAMLSHSVMSDWNLSPAKNHGAWFQDLIKLRFLMSHCKKISERHSNR